MDTTTRETATVTLPVLVGESLSSLAGWMANETDRYNAVDSAFAPYDVAGVRPFTVADVPDAWRTGPLSAWCYMVLELNNIPRDDHNPRPLSAYGIDLAFASSDVAKFVWFLA